MDILLHRSLFITGLALEENETFLRWLLIERMKYFRKFPDRRKKGWFLTGKTDCSDGKKFFLEKVGIEVIEADNYHVIYRDIWE